MTGGFCIILQLLVSPVCEFHVYDCDSTCRELPYDRGVCCQVSRSPEVSDIRLSRPQGTTSRPLAPVHCAEVLQARCQAGGNYSLTKADGQRQMSHLSTLFEKSHCKCMYLILCHY